MKFTRSHTRWLANTKATRTAAQRCVIGNRQINRQHGHDRPDQSFTLTQRQSKQDPQSEDGFNGEIKIMALSNWRRARMRLPTGNRFGREPDRQAAAMAKRRIIVPPVCNPMTLARNVVPTLGLVLERNDPLPT